MNMGPGQSASQLAEVQWQTVHLNVHGIYIILLYIY